MGASYICHIYKNKQLIRKYYLSDIPRIGESLCYYSSEAHGFVVEKIVDIVRVIAVGKEPIIKIYV